MASGFESLMRVNCAGKMGITGCESFRSHHLNAAIGECLFEYCVAIPRCVIDRIIYRCYPLVAEFFLSYLDTPRNQHICGMTCPEDKIANCGQVGGNNDRTKSHDPIFLRDRKKLIGRRVMSRHPR